MGFIPRGNSCKIRGFRGAWDLAVCGIHQTVWNATSLGGSRATSGNNVGVAYLFALDVRGLQGLDDTLKRDLLECSLSFGSERYRLSCGSSRG